MSLNNPILDTYLTLNPTNPNLLNLNFDKLKILQINLQRSKSAQTQLLQTISNNQYHIILCQEPYTFKNDIRGIPLSFNAYFNKHSSNIKCLTLINTPINPISLLIEDNIIVLWLNLLPHPLILINIYANPNGNLKEILNKIKPFLNKFKNCLILILGDFNSQNSIWNYPTTNNRGKIMESFISSSNLNLLNNINSPPTFTGPNGVGWPDLSLCNDLLFTFIQNWRVLEDNSCSDHNYIEMIIDKPSFISINKRFNSNKHNKKFINKLQQHSLHLNTLIDSCSNLSDLDNLTEKLINTCKQTAEETLSYRNPTKIFKLKWWNPQLKTLKNKTKALRRRFKNIQDHTEKTYYILQYKKAQATYKKEILQAKLKSWQDYCTRTNSAYSVIEKIATNKIFKPTNFVPLQTTQQDSQISNSIFTNLLEFSFPDDPTNTPITPTSSNTNIEPPFTKTELKITIKKLNKTKAPGMDGIDNGLVKLIYRAIPNTLLNFYNTCLRLQYFPKIFKIGQIIYFLKKDKPANIPNSYRPICLLSAIGKVLERLITNRLKLAGLSFLRK